MGIFLSDLPTRPFSGSTARPSLTTLSRIGTFGIGGQLQGMQRTALEMGRKCIFHHQRVQD